MLLRELFYTTEMERRAENKSDETNSRLPTNNPSVHADDQVKRHLCILQSIQSVGKLNPVYTSSIAA